MGPRATREGEIFHEGPRGTREGEILYEVPRRTREGEIFIKVPRGTREGEIFLAEHLRVKFFMNLQWGNYFLAKLPLIEVVPLIRNKTETWRSILPC